MSKVREPVHGQWSSPTIFVLVAAGSVIGLGNVWTLPTLAAANGGGLFLLAYLLCLAGIAVPLMITELALGKRGGGSPVATMHCLAKEAGRHRSWRLAGVFVVLTGFLLLSCGTVIGGWALHYVVYSALGMFSDRPSLDVARVFGDLVTSPELLLLGHTLFTVMTMWVVARGVRRGLEQAARYLVPLIFAVLLVMLGYAMNTGHFEQGIAALVSFDLNKFTLNSMLRAMEYSLFTLTLGTGALMSYGAYLPKKVSVVKATFVVAGIDLMVSLMTGMAIFPLLFAKGIEASAGPGLVFQTLPFIFGQMPNGALYGVLFYLMLIMVAWTTLISFAEPAVAWLVERRGMSRPMAAWWVGGGAWLLGVAAALSFNRWADEPYLLFGKTFFYRLDYLTSGIMIPVGGLLVAIFAGRLMCPGSMTGELGLESGVLFRSWRFLVRFVVPVAVLMVFLHAIGVIQLE